jgi:hypothetical protein
VYIILSTLTLDTKIVDVKVEVEVEVEIEVGIALMRTETSTRRSYPARESVHSALPLKGLERASANTDPGPGRYLVSKIDIDIDARKGWDHGYIMVWETKFDLDVRSSKYY